MNTSGGVVAPLERLAWPKTIGLGLQHVVAMFGATFLVPILTGFPPTTTLFFSGVGTLLFLLITRNRLPSYLGSSFAFIAPVTAATAADGMGSALGGIIVVGALLALIGLLINVTGTGWVDALMPPVVMGTIVALIGFNLAPVVATNLGLKPAEGIAPYIGLDSGLVTIVAVLLVMTCLRGLLGRLSIFLGVIIGYVYAAMRGQVDFTAVHEASWFGLPTFHAPSFSAGVLPAFLPIILVLIAENVGHIRTVSLMTGQDLNHLTGRALISDGLASMLAGAGGGSATTTYGENIGVMAATRVYSTAAYWVAGSVAILLGFLPKVGALINSIPAGVLGGVTLGLYGMIGVLGIRIFVDHKVDFSRPVNQMTVGIPMIIAVASITIQLGGFTDQGIAIATVACLLVHHGMTALGRVFKTQV
ncbi:purine/pyrimidine permease [Micrococcales bacterium 31B]|nr:purine/pyrimidine permease [Micrococcales bacterium 31B]